LRDASLAAASTEAHLEAGAELERHERVGGSQVVVAEAAEQCFVRRLGSVDADVTKVTVGT